MEKIVSYELFKDHTRAKLELLEKDVKYGVDNLKNVFDDNKKLYCHSKGFIFKEYKAKGNYYIFDEYGNEIDGWKLYNSTDYWFAIDKSSLDELMSKHNKAKDMVYSEFINNIEIYFGITLTKEEAIEIITS